jgi:hypothetical protein
MNTIIVDVQSAYDLLNARRTGDVNFYVNSLYLVNDYNSVSQFNNVGVNSNYLINTLNIGTDKLKNNLQTSTVVPTIVNSTTTTSTSTTTADSTYTSVSPGLSPTGVTSGSYPNPINMVVDAYGRVTSLQTGGVGGPVTANSYSSGSWTITQSGTKLLFSYGGTTVFSIDSSGNAIAKSGITAFDTP